MPATRPRAAAAGGAEAARRPRRYPADYKISVLRKYDALNPAGRRELLRAEGLRASLVSQWRAQVYEAAREALSADPGGKPARRIHVSDPVWADLTALAASAEPPMSPERLARALFAWATGREDRLPVTPVRAARPGAPAAPEGPAEAG